MKVKDNQSLFDIGIQGCGSAETAFDIALLNGISISDEPDTGTELKIPEVIKKDIVTYFSNNLLTPATGITKDTGEAGLFDDLFEEIFE